MARRRKGGRNVLGVLLLDKPLGMGSNEVLQLVKRLFDARKAGHTGSLDRLACGLLPICFGEATKLSGYLLEADKHYQATVKLGERTTTGDAEGEVLETRPVGGIERAHVERALERFRGEVEQIPPMYSAVKYRGQRLYRLAQKGMVVERQPRTVAIHKLKLVSFDAELLQIEVSCSKGTYIRTLAEDIGEELGCGARIDALRRTGAGPFEETAMVSLSRIRELATEGMDALDSLLMPMESALPNWPSVRMPENCAFYLRMGQAVMIPHAPTSGWVKMHAAGDRFLGVGEVLDDGRIAPRRLVNTGI